MDRLAWDRMGADSPDDEEGGAEEAADDGWDEGGVGHAVPPDVRHRPRAHARPLVIRHARCRTIRHKADISRHRPTLQ